MCLCARMMEEDYDQFLRGQETKLKEERYSPKVHLRLTAQWHMLMLITCSSMEDGNMPGTDLFFLCKTCL